MCKKSKKELGKGFCYLENLKAGKLTLKGIGMNVRKLLTSWLVFSCISHSTPKSSRTLRQELP